jgi:prephenate dehydrogenase
MTVKIAIIGLGQIGASIGLALASHKDQVSTIGYDSSGEVNRKAHNMKAVEKIGHGLYASVEQADMVILALPLDQVRETLQAIGQDVREQAVVLDTAPVKSAVAAWAEEFLPFKHHYVGLSLALNPLLLDETGSGIDSARADLFQNGLAAITAPPGTSSEAIKLAATFVTLLGSHVYFTDSAEADGIMATIHTLPTLAAAAMVETIIGQPDWMDIRKLAGRHFMSAMHQLDGEKGLALAEAVQMNRINTVRVLDEYIAALESLRDEVEKEEKSGLRERFKAALHARAEWQRERGDSSWHEDESQRQMIPTFNDILRGPLGLGKMLGRPKKKPEDD